MTDFDVDNDLTTVNTPVQRNPYGVALTVIWVVAFSVALVFAVVAFLTDTDGSISTQQGVTRLYTGAAVSAAAGFVTLIAHLGSLATRWQHHHV